MRGSLKRRGPSWCIVVDLGFEPDQATGEQRRKQKRVTFKGTRKQADQKLAGKHHSRIGVSLRIERRHHSDGPCNREDQDDSEMLRKTRIPPDRSEQQGPADTHRHHQHVDQVNIGY